MAPTVPPPLDQIDPIEAWQPWEPGPQDPWDLKWAGHLYRRAAFGASPAEMADAVSRGLPATLDLLLNGGPNADSLEKMLLAVGRRTADRANDFELRAWWVYAMLNGGRPAQEKMVLFWHNHFATSIAKVQRTTLMFDQNVLLRKHALGKFGPFLHEMSKDAAMIVWLDNNSNFKSHPNENYAREVMELFSLGVGHYTEKDIREAARAFSGWHTNGPEFDFNARFHDDGQKTVLGHTGAWNGDDVLDILLKRLDCAEFLVRKLYRHYVSELHDPPAKLLAPLAEGFRTTDYDIGALVRRILSSRHFFSDHAFRRRIKSPVEYVLGAVRTVHAGDPPPPQPLVRRLEVMGQQLFAPPNVKGWPGGQAWLNTSTVLARVNFAQALVMGNLWGDSFRGEQFEAPMFETPPGVPQAEVKIPEEPPPPDGQDVARLVREAKAAKPEEVVRVLVDAFLPGGVGESARAKLTAFVADGKPAGDALGRRVREAAHAILSMPEYQLA